MFRVFYPPVFRSYARFLIAGRGPAALVSLAPVADDRYDHARIATAWQNCFAERLIGSIRRECTDHLMVFGAQQRRALRSYSRSYNGEARENCCHLHKQTPANVIDALMTAIDDGSFLASNIPKLQSLLSDRSADLYEPR